MSFDDRLLQLIAGLRAGGVRISVAESADGFRAVEEIGAVDREALRAALRTTLVKDPADLPTFDRLFPLYFGLEPPPLLPALGEMGADEQQQLEEALRSLPPELADLLRRLLRGERLSAEEMAQLRARLQPNFSSESGGSQGQQALRQHLDQLAQSWMDRLARLLQWLLSGQGPSSQELEQIGREVGLPRATRLEQQPWLTQRMLRAMGMERLAELLNELLAQLAAAGASQETLDQLEDSIQANAEALRDQVGRFVGASIARQAVEQPPRPTSVADLMQLPLQSLTWEEAEALRDQVRRLAAQLRSRAALRHRRGKVGLLDPKATIRANQRYGGVPMDIRHRRRRLKPKLVLICDVSTSMRPVVSFLLHMIYELQDQVAHARSFAFIDDIEEITQDFTEHRPEVAIAEVLRRMPPGHYNTDFGFSLQHFCRDYLDAVDRRTIVIVVGDGRNNFNPSRVDAFETIRRRARRVLWFNPEAPALWGAGDSAMYDYLPLCDAVHEVSTLAQLTAAVERLFET